jgi:cytochrome d ubiquinol oxidase subunit II
MTQNYYVLPVLWVVPLLTLAAVLATPWLHKRAKDGAAFAVSSLTVAGLMGLFGIGLYPNMVRSIPVANSLTVANASSTPLSQTVMLIIACIGMPLVLGYSAYIYWVFRGKVKLEKESY